MDVGTPSSTRFVCALSACRALCAATHGTMNMSKLESTSRTRLPRFVWMSVACVTIFNIAACSGQQRSEAPMNTTNKVEEAAAPLRKLKANPAQAYEIRLTLKNPPGPFASVAGVTQFDVVNYALCGEIVPVAGIAGRISSN